MKKLLAKGVMIAVTAAMAVTASISLSACAHVHNWQWHRTETEHWQECKCGEKRFEGEHEDMVCDDCAEFKVLAFGFNSGGDSAHSDFANDANEWFSAKGKELGFIYEYSNTGAKGWVDLNGENLENYDLVMFLNDRPSGAEQQEAFKNYMDNGGAWMGFHACAFSMVNYSKYETREDDPGYWSWYQDEFVRCGDYVKNTWDPTSEPLTVETYDHCATENLELEDDWFLSAPCEWYGWEYDLFEDENITVLLTLNPTEENPAGDDPRPGYQWQIWTEGHYPIAWANNNYNMVYMNWGHNLQNYNLGEEGTSSSTFCREAQNQFMIDAMFGLTKK